MPPVVSPSVKILPSIAPPLPNAWEWFVDELLPTFVKTEYSPRESWKGKPFAKEDAHFFLKGITELSELFTEDRPERVPAYFQHPKFRSAYLLYFLPLQMAKIVTLFQQHSQAIDAALSHAKKTGKLRILDLGAGPGTASLAFLLGLLARPGEAPPEIELVWIDTSHSILEDGKKIALSFADQFPKLRDKVRVRTIVAPWWEFASHAEGNFSLIIMGHILNEAREIPMKLRSPDREVLDPVWTELLDKASGAGVLFIEPASRSNAQFLSRLRDRVIEAASLDDTGFWGPCLHAGKCPLSEGRDWCHFSVSARISGKWFAAFSKALGSERQWLKFSFLWMAAKDFPAPQKKSNQRLVVSDPLSKSAPQRGAKLSGEVLLCEPERPARASVAQIGEVWRGDILEIPDQSAGPRRLRT